MNSEERYRPVAREARANDDQDHHGQLDDEQREQRLLVAPWRRPPCRPQSGSRVQSCRRGVRAPGCTSPTVTSITAMTPNGQSLLKASEPPWTIKRITPNPVGFSAAQNLVVESDAAAVASAASAKSRNARFHHSHEFGRRRVSVAVIRSDPPAIPFDGRQPAEREGFEPSRRFNTPYSLSRRAPSTTRPPLQSAADAATSYVIRSDVSRDQPGGGGGIRTHETRIGPNGFQDRLLRPLGHPSRCLKPPGSGLPRTGGCSRSG